MNNLITTQKQTVETYLPVFPGFYETLFQYDGEEQDIQGMIDEGEAPEDATWDDFNWDYRDYESRVAKACVFAIEEHLNEELDIPIEFKFQNVYSPREYNFHNDSINVECKVSNPAINKILNYCEDNFTEFESYIQDRFTSRSGFTSFFSNDPNVWLNVYLKELDAKGNYLGTFLDFILLNEEYTQEDLYYATDSERYIGYELKE